MPGPAPKANAVRRNIRPDWVRLPAEGRKTPAPKWPLGKPLPGELEVWREIWALPQALMWEKFRWFRTVGRYVRVCVRSEQATAGRDMMAEARQLEDRLGLTPKSMTALRWAITDDEVGQRRDDGAGAPAGGAPKRQRSAKAQTSKLASRLKAV